MRVLVLKTSSLGDVIHTLPALTDAAKVYPDIQFDWVVEEGFQMIPKMHPNVQSVIPIALRRWRRNLKLAFQQNEIQNFLRTLRKNSYDCVIDAQGLIKSAVLAKIARGKSAGFNFQSAREGVSSIFYNRRSTVSWELHAVNRTRILFAKSLNYDLPNFKESGPGNINYGIDASRLSPYSHPDLNSSIPYYIFLHGTTWATKHWPEAYWIALGKLITSANPAACIALLWGNELEHQRALRIAAAVPRAIVLPKVNLQEVVSIIKNAQGIVSVDTGLGHLAAALSVPTVSLYGPSDSRRTGTYGQNQIHLQAQSPSCAPCRKRECFYRGERPVDPPCFTKLNPETVLDALRSFQSSLQVFELNSSIK